MGITGNLQEEHPGTANDGKQEEQRIVKLTEKAEIHFCAV